jgi:hypothetical protein
MMPVSGVVVNEIADNRMLSSSLSSSSSSSSSSSLSSSLSSSSSYSSSYSSPYSSSSPLFPSLSAPSSQRPRLIGRPILSRRMQSSASSWMIAYCAVLTLLSPRVHAQIEVSTDIGFGIKKVRPVFDVLLFPLCHLSSTTDLLHILFLSVIFLLRLSIMQTTIRAQHELWVIRSPFISPPAI